MRTAFRIAALFVVYSGIGWGGEYAADLLAQDLHIGHDHTVEFDVQTHVDEAVERHVTVDVRPKVEVDIQIRHSGGCDYTETEAMVIPIDGQTSLRIGSGAGHLSVQTNPTSDEVRVGVRSCASEAAWLDELTVETAQGPNVIDIVTRYPQERSRRGNNTARIDLSISVPVGFAVSIDDSSGDIEVQGVGDLRIEDSSGSIDVQDIEGAVWIDDSSGGVTVQSVMGDLQIEDGSGGIEVRDVQGSVAMRDGSGGIDIYNVGQDVLIESDGSGSIDVQSVGGDFFVESDGSGGITYADVAGEVSHPDRKRRRRHRRPGR